MKNLSRAAFFILFILVRIFLANFILAAEKIDINTAPLEDLIKIIHIWEKRALELISLRPFSSLDELTKIKGINQKRLEDIKKQGLAWVNSEKPEVESKKGEVKISYPSGIFFNEILPSPKGADQTNEWIEIFNQNNFEVDLTDWKIEDISGRKTTYTFPKETIIGPGEFLILSRPTTKITLNNDGDGLNLIQPDGKIVDQVSYEKAPQGQSYNRTPTGWLWSTYLTPGSENIISTQETKKTEEIKDTSAEVKSPQIIDINTASVKELQKLAAIGPVLAQRIIEARPFYSLDELAKIEGIGPKTLEDIKKQGLAWVDPTLALAKIEKTEPQELGLAAVANPIKAREIPKFLFLLLTALTLATFSGTIILILKNKLKKNYNKNI